MDVGLLVAGILCVALAAGHTTIGVLWVLPSLSEERVPATPFGPPSLTLSMLRVTWFIVTIFALALGGLLITLAAGVDLDPRTQVLRWFAVMWLVATAMAALVSTRGRGTLRHIVRLPVPLVWVVIAALCWRASA